MLGFSLELNSSASASCKVAELLGLEDFMLTSWTPLSVFFPSSVNVSALQCKRFGACPARV